MPLSALYLADLLYEAGLPPEMLSIVTGDPREIADELDHQPRRRPGHLHRRRRDRQGDRRQGRLSPDRPRARRQRSAHRHGRRRPRRGGDARGPGLVRELRPALHRGQAHARPRGDRRRASPSSWSSRPSAGATATRATKSEMGTVIDEEAARLFEARVAEAVGQGARLLGRQPASTARSIRRPCSTASGPR